MNNLHIAHVSDARSTKHIPNHHKADNCVRENKNNTFLKFLPWLLLQKGLEFSGLVFQTLGHTHGSLGALVFNGFEWTLSLIDGAGSCIGLRPSLWSIESLDAIH